MAHTFRAPVVALKLGEGATASVPDKVQIFKAGSYHHPKYGKFDLTSKVFAEMVKNFNAGVRRIDLAIDYKHESEDIAAGWIKALFLSEDGEELWAEVDWTPNGKRVLADKEFRYLSGDFVFDYQDNESLKTFGPTLLGAGLTNRPVVKGMAPAVELMEGQHKGDPEMKTVEQLTDDNKKLAEQIKTLSDQVAQMEKDAKEEGGDDEMGNLKKQLADSKAALEAMTKKCEELQAGAVKSAEDKKLAEKKSAFDRKLSEGSVVEAQREPFMAGDMDKFVELAKPINLSERGSGGSAPPAAEGDAQMQILALAETRVKDGKSKDLASAIGVVLAEKPDLAKLYRGK